MRHEVDAMGKQCPIPVVMTKKVIDKAAIGDAHLCQRSWRIRNTR